MRALAQRGNGTCVSKVYTTGEHNGSNETPTEMQGGKTDSHASDPFSSTRTRTERHVDVDGSPCADSPGVTRTILSFEETDHSRENTIPKVAEIKEKRPSL